VLDTLTSLLSVLGGMAVGLALRQTRAATQADGEFVFKLVFYVCLPALMFSALATVEVSRKLIVFLLAPPVLVTAGYLAALLVARGRRFSPIQVPVLMTAAMIVNAGFTLPFVQALYGPPGVARIAVFDGVNAALTFSWAYSVAARGNPEHEGGSLLLGRTLRSPPLYGIVAGLAVNLSGVQPPQTMLDVARPFASAVPVLLSLAIGITFAPVSGELTRAGVVVLTRLVSAMLVLTVVILVLDLDEMDRTILLLLGVAPVAFVTVTFASLENLDIRLATSALSVSLAVSLVLSLSVALLSA
jgi:predicted permease